MTDLTFTDIQADSLCPDNSFVVQDGKVWLDVGTLIEESVTSLDSGKFAELCFKLGRIGRNAQVTKNLGGGTPLPTGSQVNSFDAPIFTTPTLNTAGLIQTSGSITVRVKFEVDPNNALTNNI